MRDRPFREGDLRLLQGLAQEVWRTEPRVLDSDTTVGGLAWSTGAGPIDPRMWDRRLWFDGEHLVAWGWVFFPGYLVWQVHPAHAAVLDRVVAWFESRARTDELRTSVRPANTEAVAILAARGWADDPDEPFALLMHRTLDEIGDPSVPEGFRLRTMAEVGDHDRRLEAHRAAWEPSSLTAERWARVRWTWPYREDLDCVVQAPDGTLAAYVLAWLDHENEVGEFEPVGTHPSYRQMGLGRAVSLFALGRLRDAGARDALVACRGDADYPIPKRLYESVGFRELSRQRMLVKKR